MIQNKLILRNTQSPFTGENADITQGSVLSLNQLDGNLIHLKGHAIYSAATSGSSVSLKKLDGSSIDFDLNISSNHNDLIGLQGGKEGEYYHLTEAQNVYLVDIVTEDKIGLILSAITVHPTYVVPTSSLNNITNTYEIGSTQSISLTQTFTQGDGGAKLSENISKNSSIVSTTNTFNESLTVPVTGVTYAGTVTYGQGICKINNIGITDCVGRIEAGTSVSSNRIITGVYPVFYFKSATPITSASMKTAIENGTATKVVVASTGTITVPYAPSSQYMAVAYPSASTTKTRWYVTDLSQGDIPGGVFGAASTQSIDSPTSLWNGINYKIHVTPLLDNAAAGSIQLRNS